MSARSSWRARGSAAGTLVLALSGATVALCGPALAHVTVTPDTAHQGGYATLTFRVPDESDTASTTALTVDLPVDTPLASVRLRPVPGWTGAVTSAALRAPVDVGDLRLSQAPRSITWTAAAGQGVAPGQFQEFAISVGPLPKTSALTLPATQTYSDGQVVHWNEPPAADGSEPEHPAPKLTLQPAAAPAAGLTATAQQAQVASAGASTDTTARVLGSAGLLVGAAGVAAALLARRRARA